MKEKIALLTSNNSLVADFQENAAEIELILYKKVETIRLEDYSLFFIDFAFFPAADSVQFYLAKIRKKLASLPLVLIFRVNDLLYVDSDWSFDDFILFPFRKDELITRINRFSWKNKNSDEIIQVGKIRINLKEYTVFLENKKLELTYKEFEILKTLVENKKIVFSRKDLLNKIWGLDYIGGTRTVDVHIRRLRGKLGKEFSTLIETIRNVGYKCKG